MQDAFLELANLSGANLEAASLTGAKLGCANLESANLGLASGFIFDETYTRNTKFGTPASDPWSILRRKYTGPAMLWNMLALITACLPYTMKALYWSALNRWQNVGDSKSNCGAEVCNEFTVLQLVLGLDRNVIYWAIPVTLIVYNILRGFLTYRVAPMRDEEERSGVSPAWKGKMVWQGYRPLYWMHRAVSILFWLAFLVFLFNALHWLNLPVWVPAN